jgi:hypothetical protein
MGMESDRAGATIAEMPGVLAENCPGSTAFVAAGGEAGGEDVTFADLAEQVRALAAGITDAGLSPGDSILAWTDPSLDYLRLVLAASQAGLAVIPVDADRAAPAVGRLAERLRVAAMYLGGDRQLPENVTSPVLRLTIGDTPGLPDTTVRQLGGAAGAPLVPPADLARAPLLIVPDEGDRAAVLTQRAAKSGCRLNAIAFRLPLRGALIWPGYPGGLAEFTTAALAHLHVAASIEIAEPAAYAKSLAASPPGGFAYAHAGALRGGIADALRDAAELGTIYLPVTAAGSAHALREHAASLTTGAAREDRVLLRGWNPAEHGLALVAGWRGDADLPAHEAGLAAVGQFMPDVEARLAGGPGSRATLELRSPALMAGYADTGPAISAGDYFDTNRAAAVTAGGLLHVELGQENTP